MECRLGGVDELQLRDIPSGTLFIIDDNPDDIYMRIWGIPHVRGVSLNLSEVFGKCFVVNLKTGNVSSLFETLPVVVVESSEPIVFHMVSKNKKS